MKTYDQFSPITALAVVLAVYACTVLFRLDAFHLEQGTSNLEATYHAIWTIQALQSSPSSAHWYLPSVTLMPLPGNPIHWGSTILTTGGSYVYTSFPPLGFLVPMWLLSAFNLEVSFLSLTLLNTVFGLIAALGLGLLVREVVTHQAPEPGKVNGWVWFTWAAALYLLLNESLKSHGLVYWSHSISQAVLCFASWMLARMLFRVSRHLEQIALVGLCFIFPLLEWTGYIFNAGVIGVLVYQKARQQTDSEAIQPMTVIKAALSGLPLIVGLLTLLAGLGTVAHYMAATGVQEVLNALWTRALDRSAIRYAALIKLPLGYLISFGLLFPLGILAAILLLCGKARRPDQATRLLLIAVTIPLVENVIMAQHAFQFSFDRLKLVLPLFLASALLLVQMQKNVQQKALLSAVALIVLSNIALYFFDASKGAEWPRILMANRRIADAVLSRPESTCALMGTNGTVRGAMNLLFKRDILELMPLNLVMAEAQKRNACAVIYVSIESAAVDLPRVDSATLYTLDGTVITQFGTVQ